MNGPKSSAIFLMATVLEPAVHPPALGIFIHIKPPCQVALPGGFGPFDADRCRPDVEKAVWWDRCLAPQPCTTNTGRRAHCDVLTVGQHSNVRRLVRGRLCFWICRVGIRGHNWDRWNVCSLDEERLFFLRRKKRIL